MKKKCKALVLMLFIGGSVLFAQSNYTQKRVTKKVDHIAEKLSLTEEQREEVYAIHMKYAKRMGEAREAGELKTSKRENREATRKDLMKDLSTVLTADQMEKMEVLRKERGARSHKKFDGRGKHMEHMAKSLDLTDAQQKELKTVHKRHMKKMKAIRAMDISDADKKARKKELKAEMQKSYKNILTEAQFKKFRAMRKMEHKRSSKNWAEPAK